MRSWRLGEICEHGRLGRSCPICERDEEIARLTEERDAYWQALMRIRSDDENAGITAQVVLAMYAGEKR